MSGRALVIGVIGGTESTVTKTEDMEGESPASPPANPASAFGNITLVTCHPPHIVGQRGEERLLAWSAYAQLFAVRHHAILVGDARHMLEIHQIAGIRAEEMVVGEFRFHVFERAIDRQFAFQRVDDDGMPDRFEIQNIGKIQPHLPVAGFDKHGIVAIAPHHVDRLLEFL